MPIYIYECDDCTAEDADKRTFQVMKPMSESSLAEACPACGKPSHHRRYDIERPGIMQHALPDGTKRFDGLRTQRELEKAKKQETDKKRRAKLDAEIKRVGGVS